MTVAAPPAPPPERVYSSDSLGDILHRLGDIPAARVRVDPQPGTATLADLTWVNECGPGPACELIDGTLVEKPVGFHESSLATLVGFALLRFLDDHDLGMIVGEAAVMEILPGIGRAPDVAFIAWASLPGGIPPPREDAVPAVVPDLAVEVLSASNTRREMARKRAEYFRAGVKLVWEIDPATRSATVYTADDAGTAVPADGTLTGDPVLPGFVLSLKAVFDRAERRGAAKG